MCVVRANDEISVISTDRGAIRVPVARVVFAIDQAWSRISHHLGLFNYDVAVGLCALGLVLETTPQFAPLLFAAAPSVCRVLTAPMFGCVV